MEPNLWSKFVQLVKESFSSKFKAFFPGCIVGLLSAKSLLFAGLASEVITFWAFLVKFVATVVMSFGSGLATSYAALIIERYKNRKQNVTRSQRRKGKGDKAA
jgi:hypothetical protein